MVFFMYTKTTHRFCSGSQLPSTHFPKNCRNRQFQVAEGSQLPSTHFRKIAKKMQLKVAEVATYQLHQFRTKLPINIQIQDAHIVCQIPSRYSSCEKELTLRGNYIEEIYKSIKPTLPYLSNFPLDFFPQKIESCELQLITATKVANYFTL